MNNMSAIYSGSVRPRCLGSGLGVGWGGVGRGGAGRCGEDGGGSGGQ